eukprot:966987-Pyramimonas_sp.AAC.1
MAEKERQMQQEIERTQWAASGRGQKVATVIQVRTAQAAKPAQQEGASQWRHSAGVSQGAGCR